MDAEQIKVLAKEIIVAIFDEWESRQTRMAEKGVVAFKEMMESIKELKD